MAGPEVTLTFAGDDKQLTKAMANVGNSAKQMSDQVGSASKSFGDAGQRTDEWVDKADKADQRAMGFRDTITGLQDSFKGLSDDSLPLGERLLTLGMGVGDLASGFANLLIPAMSSFATWLKGTTAATWLMTAAQTAWAAITKAVTVATAALNAVMRANPIMFVVGLLSALVIAFGVLWNKSEGFRNFFIGMWNGIKTVVGNVVQWIKDVWNGIPGFFRGIVDGIGKVFSGIGNAIKNAFKGAINFVIDIINGAVTAINGLISGINLVPGVNIPKIPKIPKLHTGGYVPGTPGTEQLVMLQAGEYVGSGPSSGGRGGDTVTFAGDVDSAFATAFMKLVRTGKIRIG